VPKGLVVLGAGGHAKVLISALKELNINILAILDDDEQKWGKDILGIRISGPIEKIKSGNFNAAVIAIGDNGKRKELAEQYVKYCQWQTIIHPYSYVHPSTKIGPGSVVFAGAIIQPDALIGDHVIINTGATIDHDCTVGNFVHIAPGVHLAGNVSVGEGSFLGIGSSVIPNKKVGKWSIVGAGAVVIEDLPDFSISVGIPARPIKQVERG
jgi:sugar O-acyltransferase (sialic acid O-acetyltransferase NeuD family)